MNIDIKILRQEDAMVVGCILTAIDCFLEKQRKTTKIHTGKY